MARPKGSKNTTAKTETQTEIADFLAKPKGAAKKSWQTKSGSVNVVIGSLTTKVTTAKATQLLSTLAW